MVCLAEETVGDMKRGAFLPRFSLGEMLLWAWDAIEAIELRFISFLALPETSVSVPIPRRAGKAERMTASKI